MDFSRRVINLSELIGARLPEQLVIKDVISINGNDYNGKVIPYAMRLDKNGYPHFLLCLGNTWLWKSAKHFKVQG